MYIKERMLQTRQWILKIFSSICLGEHENLEGNVCLGILDASGASIEAMNIVGGTKFLTLGHVFLPC
jgi:hypothetical protein